DYGQLPAGPTARVERSAAPAQPSAPFTPPTPEAVAPAPVAPAPVAPAPAANAPTAQEIQWAQGIQQRFQAGDKTLTQDDVNKYNAIVARMAAPGAAPAQPAAPAVPAGNDLGWALSVIDQIGQGYVPSPDERSKLEQIEAAQPDALYTP